MKSGIGAWALMAWACLCAASLPAAAQGGPYDYNGYFVSGEADSNAFNSGSRVRYSYNVELLDPTRIGGAPDPGRRGVFSATGTADGTGRGRDVSINTRSEEYDCVVSGGNSCGIVQPRPEFFNATTVAADLRTATMTASVANSVNGIFRFGNSTAVLHDVLQFTVAGATAQTVTRVHYKFAVNGTWTNTVATPGNNPADNFGTVYAYVCLNNPQSGVCNLEAAAATVTMDAASPGVPRPTTSSAGTNGSWTTLTPNLLVYDGFFDIVGPTMTIRPTLRLNVQANVQPSVAHTARFTFENLPGQVRYTSDSGVFLPLPTNTGAPGAPTNVQATASGNTLNLTWGAPTTGAPATSYTLLARTAPGAPPVVALPLGAITSFAATAPNGTFLLSLTAANASGTGPESPVSTVTFPAALVPPASPTGFGVSVAGSTATFSWTAPLSGGAPSGYVLLAGTTPGFSTPFAALPVPAAATSLAIPGVPAGTYYLRLVAQNAGGTSAPSNEVTLTVAGLTAPGAPTLSASVSGRTVSVSWTPGSGGAPAGYTLSAAVSPAGAAIATVPLGGTGVSFPNVPSGTYYLRLTATNGAGTSPASNQVTVTVP
jgi:hypothetical protein